MSKMTRAEVDAVVTGRLRDGACPACSKAIGSEVVRSGKTGDRPEFLAGGELSMCTVLYYIVKCRSCAAEIRCEQIVPEKMWGG